LILAWLAFEPACLRQVGFPLVQDTTTLVVAVEEPGNPAVTQALQRVWPQANYYSSGYKKPNYESCLRKPSN